MSSILRNLLCAASLTLLPSALHAQTEVRVMAQGGMLPFTALHGGGQVEITPGGGDRSYFAEYNRWVWGMICVGIAEIDESGDFGDGRCAETGYAMHAGFTQHLRGAEVRWRPYVSAGAGVARVLEDDDDGRRPVRPSMALEGGYDLRAAGPLSLRLGARWQGRPQVGTDYVGPVIGFRLRF